MNLRIGSNVFYLQRSQRFFDGIVDDLVQGRSVVTLIPKNIDPHEMWSVLRGILLHRDVDFKEISLCQISEGRAPIIEISDSLQLEWLPPETPHTLINLLGLENLPKVIYLDRFEQMPETNFASWANFLYQWSQANKGLRVKGQDSKCICIFVTAPCIMPYLPQSDVNLAIHWWLGIPSSVEFRLLCRSEEDSQYLDVKSKWREYLLPSIAGNDIYLAEYLWNDLHLDIMQLAKQLQDFAENQGWTENALKQWGSDRLRELTIFDRGSLSNFLPEQFHNLWAQGAIAWTQEYGIELHTAALAVLKRHNELEHRFCVARHPFYCLR